MRKILIGVAAVVAASAVGLAAVKDAGTDVTDMVAVADTTSVVRIQTLWLSTATRAGNSVSEYGTDSDVMFTVYQGSERVLRRTILGRGGRFDQGAADLVPISVYSENIRVVPANLALTVRLTIRGDDAWVADFIMLFGQGGGLTFPIGTLTPRGLSTDPGDLAVRTTTLRPTVLGGDSTSIESLLLLTETSAAHDAGSDIGSSRAPVTTRQVVSSKRRRPGHRRPFVGRRHRRGPVRVLERHRTTGCLQRRPETSPTVPAGNRRISRVLHIMAIEPFPTCGELEDHNCVAARVSSVHIGRGSW